jgi:hypothetical protein
VSLVVQVTGSALIVAAFAASQAAGMGRSPSLYLAASVIGSLALAASALPGSQWGFWPWRASGPPCRSSACARHFVAQGGLSVTGRQFAYGQHPALALTWRRRKGDVGFLDRS